MRAQTGRGRRLGMGILTLATVATWLTLAPRQVGGPVAYVITDGVSMQPMHEAGDLVAVRTADAYKVGDVVAYNSRELGRIVLHRIVAIEGDRYVFKGDNNDWLDTERPTNADLVGKEWFEIAGGGKFVQSLREPRRAAVLAALAALFAFGTTNQARKKRGGRHITSRRTVLAFDGGAAPVAVAVCLAAACGFSLLGLAAIRKPLNREVTKASRYESAGAFAYSAKAPKGPAYPSGHLETGQPVFLRRVDSVDVEFDYTFAAKSSHAVSGAITIDAIVSEDSGWTRTFPVAPPTPFDGDQAHVKGVLDLGTISAVLSRLQTETGLTRSAFNLDLLAKTMVEGEVGGETLNHVFAPQLRFQLDQYQLKLPPSSTEPAVPGAEPVDPLRPKQAGEVDVPATEPNTMKLARFAIPIEVARYAAGGGALLSVIALIIAMGTRPRSFDNEVARITTRYSAALIDVQTLTFDRSRSAVQVASFEELVRLAEHHERMILHRDKGDGYHTFFVDTESLLYWFQARNGYVSPRVLSSAPPPPPPPPPPS